MKRPAHICITRHGETDWNVSGILQGWIDVPINEQGRRQAREMASSFADAGFTAVCTSPLVRARETAEIVTAALGLPPQFCHDGIKERHFGEIQGVPKSELADLNPMLLQQILRRNPCAEFEGGESMDAFADRVLGGFMEIGARHPGERVLVVTHGWVMDVVTRHIEGLPRSTILNHKRKNGESVWVEASTSALLPEKQTV